MSDYLEKTREVYKNAAEVPDVGLCCTTTPVWQLPGLTIPKKMLEMNYGCGSTVHSRDLVNSPDILYVGVGGGMELLQFSYYSRRKGAVTGVDLVPEMLNASKENLLEAERLNPWFQSDFISLREGNALQLPVGDETMDLAAQNCLFNIFKADDLVLALKEMYRVLKPGGRLILSDPVCEDEIPNNLKEDETLRALCLSGAISLRNYTGLLASVGFGTLEIRAKRPYRILDPQNFEIDKTLVIESVEVCAIKDPMPKDGPCIFTGKAAIYFGTEDYFDDKKGHVLVKNQPLSVCDKTAQNLKNLGTKDIYISNSTYFYGGGGCC